MCGGVACTLDRSRGNLALHCCPDQEGRLILLFEKLSGCVNNLFRAREDRHAHEVQPVLCHVLRQSTKTVRLAIRTGGVEAIYCAGDDRSGLCLRIQFCTWHPHVDAAVLSAFLARSSVFSKLHIPQGKKGLDSISYLSGHATFFSEFFFFKLLVCKINSSSYLFRVRTDAANLAECQAQNLTSSDLLMLQSRTTRGVVYAVQIPCESAARSTCYAFGPVCSRRMSCTRIARNVQWYMSLCRGLGT
jgi:hypothetical protein